MRAIQILSLWSVVLVAAVIFLLSARDSWRELRSFFDPALIRNFLRTGLRLRWQFSLRTLLIAGFFLPPVLAALLQRGSFDWLGDWSLLLVVCFYLGVTVVPTLCYLYSEVYGATPRQIWRNRRDAWSQRDAGRAVQAMHELAAANDDADQPSLPTAR